MKKRSFVEDVFMRDPWHVRYDEMDFEVRVEELSRQHHVRRFDRAGLDHRATFRAIFRMFNEINWLHPDGPVSFEIGSYSEHLVEVTYRVSGEHYLGRLDQAVFDTRQHLALGFLREAEGSESPYYRFLCYSKILEVPFRDGRTRGGWLERLTSELTDDLAVTFRDRRLHALTDRTLAEWLRDSRNKVAHARLDDLTSDPNDYDDWEEVQWGNRLLEELAIRAIVEELGAPANWQYREIRKKLDKDASNHH